MWLLIAILTIILVYLNFDNARLLIKLNNCIIKCFARQYDVPVHIVDEQLKSSVVAFNMALQENHDQIIIELTKLFMEKDYNGITVGELDEEQREEFGHISTWKTIWLYFIGKFVSEQGWKRELPTLYSIIELHKADLGLVMISTLLPNTYIQAHTGYMKGLLRYHYPLILPRKTQKYGMKIEGEKFQWKLQQGILFDDTLVHEAWNGASDELRVVIFADIFRPELPRIINWFNRKMYQLINRTSHVQLISDRLNREML